MEVFQNLYLHANTTVARFFTGRVTLVLLITAYISSFGYFFQHLFPHRDRLLSLLSNSNQVGKSAVELPLCTRGILDKSFYEYSFDSLNVAMKPVHQDPPCRLNHYSQTETVQCFGNLLERLRLKKETGKLPDGDTGEVLMVFGGDSRIRQLYYERSKVFPFTNELFGAYHGNLISNISIFDARVRFQMIWDPRIAQDVQKIFSYWADSNTTIPHLILLGVASHYVRVSDGTTYMDYEKHLTEMYPILERLSLRMKERSNGKIVWMMQYHYYDQNFMKIQPIDGNSINKFHTHTVERLNSIARRILRNNSVVQVWDSLLPIVDDYYRGCLDLHRSAPFWLKTWKDCNDEIHAGFVATTQAFQFLLNDLCNDVMMT